MILAFQTLLPPPTAPRAAHGTDRVGAITAILVCELYTLLNKHSADYVTKYLINNAYSLYNFKNYLQFPMSPQFLEI
jgi:hypothetical protein